jgi:ATP-dependent exoDNAse (exonuclease V) beta subunit
MFLSHLHPHPRDANIVFFEENHKYSVLTDPSSSYTSVTTVVHSCFEHFDADKIIEQMMKKKNWNDQFQNKYWGMTADEIKTMWSESGKESSLLGTQLHAEIELFMNSAATDDNDGEEEEDYTHQYLLNRYYQKQPRSDLHKTNEWKYFIQFLQEYPHLRPYRTEWMVYHEDYKLSGCIDMVYENDDGTLSIYDWKRCKEINRENSFSKFSLLPCLQHIPDTNFWHYALQLNLYKKIIEEKYDRHVRDMFLIKLHPSSCMCSYEMYAVPILTDEVHQLLNSDIKSK